MKKGQGHLIEIILAIAIFTTLILTFSSKYKFETEDTNFENLYVNSLQAIALDPYIRESFNNRNFTPLIRGIQAAISNYFSEYSLCVEYYLTIPYKTQSPGYYNISIPVFFPHQACYDVYVDGKKENFYIKFNWIRIRLKTLQDNVVGYFNITVENKVLDPTSIIVTCNNTLVPYEVLGYSYPNLTLITYIPCKELNIFVKTKEPGEVDSNFNYNLKSYLSTYTYPAYTYHIEKVDFVTIYLNAYLKDNGKIRITIRYPCYSSYPEGYLNKSAGMQLYYDFREIAIPKIYSKDLAGYSTTVEVPLGKDFLKINVNAR